MDEDQVWRPGAFLEQLGDEPGSVLSNVINQNIREAASWRLVAELVRRYPEELFVVQSVPITGVIYDCLRVIRLDGAGFFDLNRVATGSGLRHLAGAEGDGDLWSGMLSEWMSIEDRHGFVRGVSEWLGMPSITRVPPTTPRTLVYRTVAGFLQAHELDLQQWRCQGAMILDDVDQASLQQELVDKFMGLDFLETPSLSAPKDLPEDEAANTWLLTRNEEPMAVLLTGGTVFVQQADEPMDLMAIYEMDRTVDSTAAALAHLVASE